MGAHHLWARNLGGAVLEFGIDAGGNDNPTASGGAKLYGAGAEFHGLVFDIDDPSHAPANFGAHGGVADTYALASWGSGADVRVEDCTFFGNGVIDVGVRAWSGGLVAPEGFVGRRLVIEGFRVYGLAVSSRPASPTSPRRSSSPIWTSPTSAIRRSSGTPARSASGSAPPARSCARAARRR
ncbi:hypothetical protein [Nannocystis pusilla]|uniref:hypothetical protein n=1 Tax=Nannocystis pusilla TaxID=889268 RepID=UPI003B80B0E9